MALVCADVVFLSVDLRPGGESGVPSRCIGRADNSSQPLRLTTAGCFQIGKCLTWKSTFSANKHYLKKKEQTVEQTFYFWRNSNHFRTVLNHANHDFLNFDHIKLSRDPRWANGQAVHIQDWLGAQMIQIIWRFDCGIVIWRCHAVAWLATPGQAWPNSKD